MARPDNRTSTIGLMSPICRRCVPYDADMAAEDDLAQRRDVLDRAEHVLSGREAYVATLEQVTEELATLRVGRDELAQLYDDLAEADDELAADRDRFAIDRDVRATDRDLAPAGDEPDQESRLAIRSLSAGDRDDAAADRANARDDRRIAGEDRKRAADSRQLAAADREATTENTWISENEVETLRRGLDSRTVTGQAVGILMERHGLTTQGAIDVLANASQRDEVGASQVAQRIVAAKEAEARR
jgi:hypothetical protein